MSFEEKNLIKDLKKLSFTSFTPFVSIPEPSATVSSTTWSGTNNTRPGHQLVEDELVEENWWRMISGGLIGA